MKKDEYLSEQSSYQKLMQRLKNTKLMQWAHKYVSSEDSLEMKEMHSPKSSIRVEKDSYPEQFDLDADTKKEDVIIISYQKIIGNPMPSTREYRCQAYTTIKRGKKVYCESNKNVSVISHNENVTRNSLADNQYYAHVSVGDDASSWQPIPTLAPSDKVTDITASAPFELGHSTETNLHYVRSSEVRKDEKLYVQYNFLSKGRILFEKNPLSTSAQKKFFNELSSFCFSRGDDIKNLPQIARLTDKEKINVLAEFILSFSEGELPEAKVNLVGDELLDAILTHQKGVCRHRAILFEAFADILGLQSNVIINGVHAFIEVRLNDVWQTLSLGGGETKTLELPMLGSTLVQAPIIESSSRIFEPIFLEKDLMLRSDYLYKPPLPSQMNFVKTSQQPFDKLQESIKLNFLSKLETATDSLENPYKENFSYK